LVEDHNSIIKYLAEKTTIHSPYVLKAKQAVYLLASVLELTDDIKACLPDAFMPVNKSYVNSYFLVAQRAPVFFGHLYTKRCAAHPTPAHLPKKSLIDSVIAHYVCFWLRCACPSFRLISTPNRALRAPRVITPSPHISL